MVLGDGLIVNKEYLFYVEIMLKKVVDFELGKVSYYVELSMFLYWNDCFDEVILFVKWGV